ncbi:MAG: hypothetical protein EBU93_04770 [Chlamydiae bacterium]|nr:hypothetical protein [Chlamydiota bacterium]
MHPALRFYKLSYIDSQSLLPLLRDYTNPNDFLSRLVKSGQLIRLKNGFYLISELIENQPIPFEQIGNQLYGPSYISLEWALSYYGLIPEGVYKVTSVSFLRSKTFKTPVGEFDYKHLSISKFAIGQALGKNQTGNFLIATPEKALIDLVYFKCKKMNAEDLMIDLVEGRRIDIDRLKNLNKAHLLEIKNDYKSQIVNTLVEVIGLL